MAEPYLTLAKDGVYLSIHAQPGAKKESLRGLHGDAVKVAVRQAAQEGKANKAIEAFVASSLGIPKRSVSVTAGLTSRSKRLFIEGDAEIIAGAIEDWLAHA